MTDGLLDPEPWDHASIPASIDARRIYEHAVEVGGSRRRRREQRRRAILAGVSCVLALVVAIGFFDSHTNPNDTVTVAERPVPQRSRRPHRPPLDHTTTPARPAVACALIVFHEKRPPNAGKKPPKTTTTTGPPPTTAAPTTTTSTIPPTTTTKTTTTTAPRAPTTVATKSPTTIAHRPKPTVVVKGSSNHPKPSTPVVRRRRRARELDGTRGPRGAPTQPRVRTTARCR